MVPEVWLRFPTLPAPDDVAPLGNAGGFSGARLWRVTAGGQPWCLRRWPSRHPEPARLHWIHSVLSHAASRGIDWLPLPIADVHGSTFVQDGGYLWEVTRWLPGQVETQTPPAPQRLRSAVWALARFHVAVADFDSECRRFGRSPAAGYRAQMLETLLAGRLDQLDRAIEASPPSATSLPNQTARQLVQMVREKLSRHAFRIRSAAQREVPQQICLRDIWRDHVLFAGIHVSGFVDFGAMRVDSVAVDLARLCGSFLGGSDWSTPLSDYQLKRQLSEVERELVDEIDIGNALLTTVQWLDWLFLERREFENVERVRQRMEEAAERLRQL